MRKRKAVAFATAIVLGTGACSSSSSPPAPPRRIVAVGGDIALVQTEGGLAGVPVGTTVPRWVHPGAVAAPDGSAVFALRRHDDENLREIVRVDALTGELAGTGTVPAAPNLRVSAVDPGGDRVALTDHDSLSTRVLDFRPSTGSLRTTVTFAGTLEPEAYSLDGSLLYAARIYGDRYHVHVLDLATGNQYPTSGPDKTQAPEDMYGSTVQAALSPDGRNLATLYRDASTPDHTAFVHLLSLENGLTICIDLHAPFGTGPIAADAIEWRDSMIAVGHDRGSGGPPTLATFDTVAWTSGEPQSHYHAEVEKRSARDVAQPGLPERIAETPGFRRFVALAR